jgi:hypothetical protein
MSSPFALPSIAIGILFLIVGLEGLYRRSRAKRKRPRLRFWYEIIRKVTVPVAGPLILAVVGFWLGLELDRQREAGSKSESKAAVLREMMTGRNGPDVAFFTALGEQLTIHLERYHKLRNGPHQAGVTDEEMNKSALFDEKAIYFFYGMFRAARVDFLATKGFILYPRIWMEVAFDRLTKRIIECFAGMKEQEVRPFSGEEQAALYRYFGASRAMYSTGNRRSSEPIPDLFEFALLLDKPPQSDDMPHLADLRRGFAEFQGRLRDPSFKSVEIIAAFDAIVGLDDYAFNTLFSTWYEKFDSKPAVDLPEEMPKDFLPYPLGHVEGIDPGEWKKERQRAWDEFAQVLPGEIQEKRRDAEKTPGAHTN